MAHMEDLIAKAIKQADKSYFFEDYNKQAKAVLSVLHKEGYKIVVRNPTEEMQQAGTDIIRKGRVKPSDFVRMIYEAMVAASK